MDNYKKSMNGGIIIPDLEPMYKSVCEYVKTHQGEKGYIDCQPYQENAGDIIYTIVYNEESAWGEERMVYGVRWNEEDKDLEICFEPYMRTYKVVYQDEDFRGTGEESTVEWYSVKWSDVYYVHTIFNIAECIEEYA